MINEDRIAKSVQSLISKYRSEGYYFIDVDVVRSPLGEGRTELYYVINEGSRVQIGDTRFTGNTLVSDRDLGKLVSSRRPGFFGKSFLNEDRIQEDRLRLIDHYLTRGFGRCEIPEVRKEFSSYGEEVVLTFVIVEEAGESIPFWPSEEVILSGSLQEETSPSWGEPPAAEEVPVLPGGHDEPRGDAIQESVAVALAVNEARPSESATEARVTETEVRSIEGETRFAGTGETGSGDLPAATPSSAADSGSHPDADDHDLQDLMQSLLLNERVKNLELKGQVATLEQNLDDMRQVLQKERQESERLRMMLEERIQQQRRLEQDKGTAESRVRQMNEMFLQRLNRMEELRDNLTVIIDDTRQAISSELDRIELSPIEVTPEVGTSPTGPEAILETSTGSSKPDGRMPLFLGRVLVVNEDLNFVVINMGGLNGLHTGQVIEIRKNGGKIAEARLIEVRQKISAADITKKTAPIASGDEVLIYE